MFLKYNYYHHQLSDVSIWNLYRTIFIGADFRTNIFIRALPSLCLAQATVRDRFT